MTTRAPAPPTPQRSAPLHQKQPEDAAILRVLRQFAEKRVRGSRLTTASWF